MAPVKQPARRRFIQTLAGAAGSVALAGMMPGWASPQGRTSPVQANSGEPKLGEPKPGESMELHIRRESLDIGGRLGQPVTINGTMPGPLLRWKEGERARIDVINHMKEDTSIHWHGILLPANMDGVPGLSFAGIKPGETFRYEFDLRQSGTYWYHSHSGLQEQIGHLGPLIIDPPDGDIGADREHVILLSDWTFENPHTVYRRLKVAEGYYNHQQRTLGDTLKDVREQGLAETWKSRAMWNRMRMSARDLLDVTGSTYTYLMNGRDSSANWTALYQPGESIRLRIINGSAMTYFDVRIPGLEMIVVAADGQPVKPVAVEEFRIGVAETYDVIVRPNDARAYTLFAESMDRSGYVRGTLATAPGQEAAIPERRPVPERGMAAMGMGHGMEHEMPGHSMQGAAGAAMSMETGEHSGHHSAHQHPGHAHDERSEPDKVRPTAPAFDIQHGPKGHGAGAAMVAMHPVSRLNEPGVGLEQVEHRVLVYGDLQGAHPWPDQREPTRTIELHLTGNMERYMWSFDGKTFYEVEGPLRFEYGERLRLVMVNDTMMDHPIHLHGMWMELENGHHPRPRKHTLSLKPNEVVSVQISADAPGRWAFHCHLLYHMKAGMFRVVEVA